MRSVPRNIGLSWVSQFVYIAAQIARVAILYRIFEEQSRGTWFLMISVAGFVVFLDFGFPNAFTRYYARGFGRATSQDPSLFQEKNVPYLSFHTLAQNAKCIFPFLSAGTFAVTLLGGLYYLHTVDTFPLFSGGITYAWLLISLGLAFSMLANQYTSILQGGGYVGLDSLVKSSGSFFTLGLLLPALFFRSSLIYVAFVEFARPLIVLLLLRGYCAKYFPDFHSIKPFFEKSAFKQLWRSSYPTFLGSIGSSLFHNSDALYIASLLQVRMLADYYNTNQMIAQVYAFSTVIVGSAFPTLLTMFGSGKVADYRLMYRKIIKYSVLFYSIFGCYFVFFGSYFLQLWLGRGHFVGVPIFVTLWLYYFFEVHNLVFMNVQFLVEKFPVTVAVWVAAALKLILTLVLINSLHLHLLGVIFGKFGAQLLTVTWFSAYFCLRTLDLWPLNLTRLRKALQIYQPILLFMVIGYVTQVSGDATLLRFVLQTLGYFCLALPVVYLFMEKETRGTLFTRMRNLCFGGSQVGRF